VTGPIVTRFAPSPTGYLHLGHAYAAFIAHDLAARNRGRFLLRIEDIDATRTRPDFVAAIEEDLRWLGLEFALPVRRQSEHLPEYRAALTRLAAMGLLYPCFCTRKAIAAEGALALAAPQGPSGPLYPGHCRSLSAAEQERRKAAGTAYVLRLDMAKAVARAGGALSFQELGQGPAGETGTIIAKPEAHGDVVLARKDSPASYHLCVTRDDALQGVTHVTRGCDLFAATAIHRLLQTLLGLPQPVYLHHRLICDSTGRRLAKRDADKTLRALRAEGRAPADIRAMVGL
jgi:glutamyl-Q tRNA(Asp) synthetase